MVGITADSPFKFRRVLVTGGQGFVGRRLIPALRREMGPDGHVVVAALSAGDEQSGDARLIRFNLAEPRSVAQAVIDARPDLVIHLAAQSSVGGANLDSSETWIVNVDGTAALAEAVKKFSPDAHFLFASSAEVYGKAFLQGVVDENTVPRPVSLYGQSKLAAEEALSAILSPSKLLVTRPCNHSGAGQDMRFVLPSFASQIRSGSDVIRVGNLEARRDFLHVDDVVEAMISLLKRRSDLWTGSPVNICSGQTVRISDLLDRMIAISGVDVQVEVDPSRLRPIDIPDARISPGRILSSTRWKPRRTLDQMLQDILLHRRSA